MIKRLTFNSVVIYWLLLLLLFPVDYLLSDYTANFQGTQMKLFSAVLLFCLVATCFAGFPKIFSSTKKFDSLRAWGDDLSNRAVALEERIFDDDGELGNLRAKIESRSRNEMDQTAALGWEKELARIGKGKGSMKTCSFKNTKWDCLVPSTSKGKTE